MAGESEATFLDQIDQRIVLIDNQIQAVKGKLTVTRRGLVLNVVYGVAVLIALLGLYAARTEYQHNREHSDIQLCQAVNDNRHNVNLKFGELQALFDASIAQSGRGVPPPLQAAYDNWKRPVPLLDCETVVNGESGLELGKEYQ